MKVDLTDEFRKIWTLADELAEEETQQFMKAPYEKRMRNTNPEGRAAFVYRKIGRTEYKDEARLKHVLEMLSMVVSQDSNDE